VLGLLSILWLIGKAVFDFLKHLRRRDLDPNIRSILHGAIATIIAILAAGFFEYNLGDSEVLTLFLSVIAGGYVVLRHQNNPPLDLPQAVFSTRELEMRAAGTR
jgi:hypothetical protein